MQLSEFGSHLVVKHVTCQYIGAGPGILLQPTVYTSNDTYAFLRTQVTVLATDKCEWAGLHIPVTFKKLYHYLMRVTVTGYAATDDITLTVHGEVF